MPNGTFPAAAPDIHVHTIVPPPPGGSDWSYTIPPRTRATLITGRATLSTQIGLASRRVQLYIRGPAGIIAQSANYVIQSPPTVLSYTLHPGCGSLPTFIPLDCFLDFPRSLLLIPGDVVGVTTRNMRITDFWENIRLQFLQHIEA